MIVLVKLLVRPKVYAGSGSRNAYVWDSIPQGGSMGSWRFCSGKFGQPGPMLPAMVNPQFDRITVNPDRFGDKPCIRELCISVGMVVQMVAAGKTIDEILAECP
jgi:hypothetical protein